MLFVFSNALSCAGSWSFLSDRRVSARKGFVFSIIRNNRLALHCAGPLDVTAPQDCKKKRGKIVIRRGEDGAGPKYPQCGASRMTHTHTHSHAIVLFVLRNYISYSRWTVSNHHNLTCRETFRHKSMHSHYVYRYSIFICCTVFVFFT